MERSYAVTGASASRWRLEVVAVAVLIGTLMPAGSFVASPGVALAAPESRCGPLIKDDPRFPCLARITLRDENQGALSLSSANTSFAIDPGLRRLVAVGFHEQGADNDGDFVEDSHIVMVDLDGLVQRGVPGFGAGFRGKSARTTAEAAGVVDINDGIDVTASLRRLRRDAIALDPVGHRLFVALRPDCNPAQDCEGKPLRMLSVSLTGAFLPQVMTFAVPREHIVRGLAYDAPRQLVYVLTQTRLGRNYGPLAEIPGQFLSPAGVALHAVDAPGDGSDGSPTRPLSERLWSYNAPVSSCPRTVNEPRSDAFLGITHAGDRLSFACKGVDDELLGSPQLTQHGIATVDLPLADGKDPRDLTDADTSDFEFHHEPYAGVMGGGGRYGGDQAGEHIFVQSVLFGNQRSLFFDYRRRAWIGLRLGGGAGWAADSGTGRIYYLGVTGVEEARDRCGDTSVVFVIDTTRLPASQGELVCLPKTLGVTTLTVIDPATRRFFTAVGDKEVVVYEDRVPVLPPVVDNPDALTNNLDEDDASEVTPIGAGEAKGTGIWWSGLGSVLPGIAQNQGDPFLTWGWMWSNEIFGSLSARVPGRPDEFSREIAGGTSQTELSEVKARALASALSYDEATDRDAKRRRGLRTWHDSADSVVQEFCREPSGTPGTTTTTSARKHCRETHQRFDREFGDPERGFDCALDAAMLGVDDNQEPDEGATPADQEAFHRGAQCGQEDADLEPSSTPTTTEPRRAEDLEDRVGVTRASHCEDRLGSGRSGHQFNGSVATCDLESRLTAAEGGPVALGLSTQALGESTDPQFPQGSLWVGSSSSRVRTFVDPRLGTVTEATAAASDIELVIAGQGSLVIGEVRSTARTSAKGRPGKAASSYHVGYQDVVITRPDGTETFSCGRSGTRAKVGSEGNTTDACDPRQVVQAINSTFTQRVVASTAERDTEEKVTGSPGGARAVVRKDPFIYWSDRIIDGLDDPTLPALQLTLYNDGTQPHRVKVDLASVYAESNYYIGAPREEIEFEPGSLRVELSDEAGSPLAGGVFDVFAQGDERVASCRTGEDGVGDCQFSALPTGDYVVSQVAAPEGYLLSPDPARVDVTDGADAVVRFVNQPNTAAIEVTLTDPQGTALPGARFGLYADVDGDRAVGGSDARLGGCATGADGACGFSEVPLGDYAVREELAPGGYKPAADVGFALQRPGQTARLRFVNSREGAAVQGAVGSDPIDLIDTPLPPTPIVSVSPPDSGPSGFLQRVARDLFGFLRRHPAEALLFMLLFGLLSAPLHLAARRRDLLLTRETT